jgi:transcriptional regulator with XRE-family HTH domain
MRFGKWLAERREKAGLSQKDISRFLGLKTAQSMSNIERGLAPLPLCHLKKCAGFLGVDPERMFRAYCDDVIERGRKKARL